MLRKHTCASLLLIAVIIGLAMVTAAAQSKKYQRTPAIDSKTYERVLDLLFPRDILKDYKLRYVFVLRYQPSFQPESQIIIVRKQDGVEVMTYRSLVGNIEVKLGDMLRSGGKKTPEQMAKHLRVKAERVNLSTDEISKLYADFLEALNSSENARLGAARTTVNVTADGTEYRLWYTGETEIQCDLQGSGVTSKTHPDEPPLMEWMKNINRMFLVEPKRVANANR